MKRQQNAKSKVTASILSALFVSSAMISCGLDQEPNGLLSPALNLPELSASCQALPTIVGKLALGETLPAALQSCDSKALAISMVARLHSHAHQSSGFQAATVSSGSRIENFEPSAYGVEIRFNPFILPLIIENGILNIHQVGMSLSASNNPIGRATLENALIGLQLEEEYRTGADNPINAVRPKYGYLSPNLDVAPDQSAQDGKRRLYFQNTDLDNYGCLIVRLKDEVKKRTTWTYGDSLAQFEEIQNLTQGDKFNLWTDPPQTLLGPVQPVLYSQNRAISYLEAQVWGPLSMDDVQAFLMDETCGMDGKNSGPASIQELQKLAQSTGRPVYILQASPETDGPVKINGLQSLGGRLPLDPGRIVPVRPAAP